MVIILALSQTYYKCRLSDRRGSGRVRTPSPDCSSNYKKENTKQIYNANADQEPPEPLRRGRLRGRMLACPHPKRNTEPSDNKSADDKHHARTIALSTRSRNYSHDRKAENCEQTHQRASQ